MDVLPFEHDTGASEWPERLRPGSWTERGADRIRDDLEAARIEFETEAGRLDFHALRHPYINGLSQDGIHPKTAQELARH